MNRITFDFEPKYNLNQEEALVFAEHLAAHGYGYQYTKHADHIDIDNIYPYSKPFYNKNLFD